MRKEQYQSKRLQFEDGLKMTMRLNDGAIRPHWKVGIGPELAARLSTQVLMGDPSGDEEHVNQLSETVSAGFRNQGSSYPSETVPQNLGIDSSRPAQSEPNGSRIKLPGKKRKSARATGKPRSPST